MIRLSSFAANTIRSSEKERGRLIGYRARKSESFVVLSAIPGCNKNDASDKEEDEIKRSLPIGLEIVGIYVVQSTASSSGSMPAIAYDRVSECFASKYGKVDIGIDEEEKGEDGKQNVRRVRCPLRISLSIVRPDYDDPRTFREYLNEEVERACRVLSDAGRSRFAVRVPRASGYEDANVPDDLVPLDDNETKTSFADALESLRDMVFGRADRTSRRKDHDGSTKKKKKSSKGKKKGKRRKGGGTATRTPGNGGDRTATVSGSASPDSFFDASRGGVATLRLLIDLGVGAAGASAPTFRFDGSLARSVVATFRLDTLVRLDTESATDVLASVRQRLVAQLRHQADLLLRLREATTTLSVRAYHFRPPRWPHLLTASFASPRDLDASERARRRLHDRFGVSDEIPQFRPSAAVVLYDDDDDDEIVTRPVPGVPRTALRDVHLAITTSSSSSQSLVRGSYEYYHYHQGNFDDAGWGCAYRSLQTIVSWFKLNHYCPPDLVRVPSHAEIQQALVDMDDKPPPFVGSKQWIGSTEIGYVVERLVPGVSGKFIVLASGSDMPSASRQLKEHFDTQGTPVMIGGGALAFTLLGIRYDESANRTSWLILDPHYTGPDDVESIVKRECMLEGYRAIPCSWRGIDAFSPKSGYNLYLPQRPRAV
eukprot:g4907.t1